MIKVDSEISLHPVTLSDADEMYALVDANREHLGRWLPWVEGLRSVGDERRWLRQRAGMDARADEEAWLIRYNGATVGAIGLIYDALNNGAEIGYWLTEAAQGQGVATRPCETLLGYAFMVRSVHRVQLRPPLGTLAAWPWRSAWGLRLRASSGKRSITTMVTGMRRSTPCWYQSGSSVRTSRVLWGGGYAHCFRLRCRHHHDAGLLAGA